MHDAEAAIEIFARAWLVCMGVVVGFGIAAYTMGTGERREASRRAIRKSLNDGGWFYLSLSLKLAAFAFPRAEHHLTWLWIPAFTLAMLTWSIKGVRCLRHWRKRTRPAESTYTRALRAATRRKP